MLEMTAGVIKLLRRDYCLHITISVMRILIAWFAFVYRFIPYKRTMYYNFMENIYH
jgi:hypothetical protein